MVCYTLILSTLTIRLCQSKTDPFNTRHTIYILATNTSACSIRASLQHKEVIPPTVRNSPVIFNFTIFPIIADACNKHSTLLTIANSSQFKAMYIPVAVFCIQVATTSTKAGFSALADQGIRALER